MRLFEIKNLPLFFWGGGTASSLSGIEEGPLPTPHTVPHTCLDSTACMALVPLAVFEKFKHLFYVQLCI